MPLDYDARLAARIREDATAAGIRTGPPGCRPNVIVMVVPNGQAVVRELRRTRSYIFGEIEKRKLDAMVADADPSTAGPSPGCAVATPTRCTRARCGRTCPRSRCVPPRLSNPTRRDINAAVLLIDVDAVIGRTVNQIADYAAMRTLARTRPAGADDTILTLFAPGDPAGRPRGLTGFDAAYLEALYHGPATALPLSKMNQIARAINAAPAARPAP